MDLEGRTAVVTGASRGLGAAIALEALRRGMRVGACARGVPALDGGEALIAERVDVADEAAVRAFAGRVAARFGAIDLWVNNAGVVGPIGPLREVAIADIERTIAVNVLGVVHGMRAFIDHLRRRGGSGVLLNISSGAARRGFPGMAAYALTKAAVDRLTESVQAEEKDSGLRAHSVAPGMIETAMQDEIRAVSADRLPIVEGFRHVKRAGLLTSPEFAARELLAVAFDPARRPDRVVIELPTEHPLPPPPG